MVEFLAIDPGITIGFATLHNGQYRIFQSCPKDYPHPHETLFDLLSSIKPQTIIYEPFHFRQGMLGAVFKGVEYIGVIELYGQLNCLEIIKITPSDGKAFWNDRKIKALNLWTPAMPHGMDALRLLLTYQMKNDRDFRNEVLSKLRHV